MAHLIGRRKLILSAGSMTTLVGLGISPKEAQAFWWFLARAAASFLARTTAQTAARSIVRAAANRTIRRSASRLVQRRSNRHLQKMSSQKLRDNRLLWSENLIPRAAGHIAGEGTEYLFDQALRENYQQGHETLILDDGDQYGLGSFIVSPAAQSIPDLTAPYILALHSAARTLQEKGYSRSFITGFLYPADILENHMHSSYWDSRSATIFKTPFGWTEIRTWSAWGDQYNANIFMHTKIGKGRVLRLSGQPVYKDDF